MADKQTAGRDRLGAIAPQFAALNDDVLFGEVWAREEQLSARDRSMITIAALVVALYFVAVLALTPVIRRLIHRGSEGRLRITYADGRGLLRTILVKASEMGFETMVTASRQMTRRDWKGAVVDMRVSGKKDVSDLLSVLSMVDGVVEVEVLDDEH